MKIFRYAVGDLKEVITLTLLGFIRTKFRNAEKIKNILKSVLN